MCARPESTKCPGDSVEEDAPLSRRARANPRMAIGLAQDDAAFRGRFRVAPRTEQPTAGSVSHVPTIGGVEDAFRNPTQGRPANGVMSPMGDPRLAPKNPRYALP